MDLQGSVTQQGRKEHHFQMAKALNMEALGQVPLESRLDKRELQVLWVPEQRSRRQTHILWWKTPVEASPVAGVVGAQASPIRTLLWPFSRRPLAL